MFCRNRRAERFHVGVQAGPAQGVHGGAGWGPAACVGDHLIATVDLAGGEIMPVGNATVFFVRRCVGPWTALRRRSRPSPAPYRLSASAASSAASHAERRALQSPMAGNADALFTARKRLGAQRARGAGGSRARFKERQPPQACRPAPGKRAEDCQERGCECSGAPEATATTDETHSHQDPRREGRPARVMCFQPAHGHQLWRTQVVVSLTPS